MLLLALKSFRFNVYIQGNRIHATAKKTLIYKFQKQLKEGVVYNVSLFNVVKNTGKYKTTHHNFKIDIIYDTKFERADNGVVPLTIYTFTTPADIFYVYECK